MNNRLSAVLLACMLVGCLSGCGSGPSADTEAAEQLAVPPVYRENCLSCHGGQLEGRVGPGLQDVGSRLSEGEIAAIIEQGRGGMPAFVKRLSEEEVASVAAWLAEQK